MARPFSCVDYPATTPRGRNSIAVDQTPGGGDDYPFVGESGISKLLADIYLLYNDPICQFVLPFHVDWIYGFGCQENDPPVALNIIHDFDICIKDSLDQIVFDSREAEEVAAQSIDSRLAVAEWFLNNGGCCRVVSHYAWSGNQDQPTENFPLFYEPPLTAINARAIERRLGILRSFRTDENPGVSPHLKDSLVLKAGYNCKITIEDNEEVQEATRQVTYIDVDIIPGEGIGVFDPECTDAQEGILAINGIKPDENGNIFLDTQQCHRIERPIIEVINATTGAVGILNHALQINNDCVPCCDCQDHINTFEGIRKLRNKYANIISRIRAAREIFVSNIDRFSAERTCRINDPLRLLLQAQCPDDLIVAVGFCNNTQECVRDLIIPISFDYTSNTGDTPPIEVHTQYAAAAAPTLFCNSVVRSGDTPEGSGHRKQPNVVEPYFLSGTWPNYYIRWNMVELFGLAYASFRLRFTNSVSTDTVHTVVDAYSGHGVALNKTAGSFPIPGYVPGAGPLTNTAKNARLVTSVKTANTSLLQDCCVND